MGRASVAKPENAMPLTADNTRSLIHGAPRISRAGGRVMLRQSRLIG